MTQVALLKTAGDTLTTSSGACVTEYSNRSIPHADKWLLISTEKNATDLYCVSAVM